ncbi:MAG: hypothetical protein LBD75_07290 [Candidatus Peribacteria bacterium]|jgi:hypothetical protein|nr:hypothetical protein [Candidatus Peribacteria bacterium]
MHNLLPNTFLVVKEEFWLACQAHSKLCVLFYFSNDDNQMTKEKKYVIGVLGLVALGAVALAINIFSTTPEPTPAVEYRAVCRNLPANAHRNGSGEKNDGTRKEIPQIQTSPNVRVPNPVGMYDEVGSDTECHFVCDEGFNRDGNSNCLLSVTIWEFDYTGNPQTFTAPRDGRYEVEAWGAEGSGYRAYE